MITGAQIRMARGYARLSVKGLAEISGVAESTIKRMELVENTPPSSGQNLEKVQTALRGVASSSSMMVRWLQGQAWL